MTEDVWEQKAQWWDETFASGADPEYAQQLVPLVKEHLFGLGIVIDIGCGEGQLARAVAADVVGLDGSMAMCQIAVRKGGLPVIRADARSLPIATASVDGAVASLVLEHLDDIDAVASEVARVLSDSGRLLVFLNHPFMQTPGSGWIEDHVLEESYWRIGSYLHAQVSHEEVEPGVVIPFNHRPMSTYVNTFANHGLVVTHMVEPAPPAEYITNAEEPDGAAAIPRLLFLRFEKKS